MNKAPRGQSIRLVKKRHISEKIFICIKGAFALCLVIGMLSYWLSGSLAEYNKAHRDHDFDNMIYYSLIEYLTRFYHLN